VTTERQFCRFNPHGDMPLSTREVPEGGLCLSSFVVLTERGHADHVLMGHLDPAAPWDHIGALDPNRAQTNSRGWMLPSSHLILRESPQEAARRILREQLGLEHLSLSDATVASETYPSARKPDLMHWDLEFLFRGELAVDAVPKPAAWKDLRFVDLARTTKQEIARSHEDILASAGLRVGIA